VYNNLKVTILDVETNVNLIFKKYYSNYVKFTKNSTEN